MYAGTVLITKDSDSETAVTTKYAQEGMRGNFQK